jgi:hypothetical protein
MRPLPLQERATRRFTEEEWVRGPINLYKTQ